MNHEAETAVTPSPELAENSGAILDLLADDDTRALFHRSASPKTIPQLATECNLPRSTAYRKAGRLIEADLLVPTSGSTDEAGEATEYRRTVERIEIEIGEATTVDFVV